MNIVDEINSVIRKITTSGDSHRVVLERGFDTDAADLWDACTSSQRLSRWFEPVRGDLALGGRYSLTSSGTEGDILRCEPTRHLTITWEYQGNVSHVDVDLIPAGIERTVLRLTHHVPPGDHWETYGPAATGVGWEEALRTLSLHLAGDARGATEEMEEFAGTPEGQQLIRRVADAWGGADHEAGTPAGDAHARAARTAAFYLGRA
ncbi:SRPBCC family protein [Ruania zhangjianzhongii]|uniref:SRPBCC family protein n=1 Tax=Ruania zhangjianzhongii TaxID=2603206 RepID=UPI00143DA338|nr:SRPBCC family protein [Ruania zhangjianzhongii]